eukprot:PhF_6_TR25823/c1_g1_i1/m.36457
MTLVKRQQMTPSHLADDSTSNQSSPCPHILRICLHTIDSISQHVALLTTCLETHRDLFSTTAITDQQPKFHSTLDEMRSLAKQLRTVQHDAQAVLRRSSLPEIGGKEVICDFVNPHILMDQLGHLLDMQKQSAQCAISCMKLLLPKQHPTTTTSEQQEDAIETRDLSNMMLNSLERLSEALSSERRSPQDDATRVQQPTLFTEDEAEEYVRRCREELRTTALRSNDDQSSTPADVVEYRGEVAKAIQEILKDLDPCSPLSLSSHNNTSIDELKALLQQQSVLRDPRQPFFSFPPDVPYRIPMIQW